jgi:hypothetical protein
VFFFLPHTLLILGGPRTKTSHTPITVKLVGLSFQIRRGRTMTIEETRGGGRNKKSCHQNPPLSPNSLFSFFTLCLSFSRGCFANPQHNNKSLL